jgi:hypothetical protein
MSYIIFRALQNNMPLMPSLPSCVAPSKKQFTRSAHVKLLKSYYFVCVKLHNSVVSNECMNNFRNLWIKLITGENTVVRIRAMYSLLKFHDDFPQ